MIVERIWTGNAYRNYNYLIACPETGEALAIDPLDHREMPGRGQGARLADHADCSTPTSTTTTPAATRPSSRPPAPS